MGNAEVHDLAPVKDDERRELNLSKTFSYRQFCKHARGDYSEACLTELPWAVRDAVSLYERMNVSFNCLTELPPELPLRLPHLSRLNLSYNQLTSLPESFGLLFHLQTVIMNNNKLKELPKSFIRLVKLEKLDISHNMLRELPADFGGMESLSRLNVSHNKLKQLPTGLGGSHVMTVLLARDNRLEFPPQYICDEGSDATLRFLRKQQCPTALVTPLIPQVNVFPRVRGDQCQFTAPNPHSAIVEYMQTQSNATHTPSRIRTPLLPPLDASLDDANQIRDKILGLIYGAAIGDALGIATQDMSPDECQFHYDSASLTYTDIIRDELRIRWRQGDWTTNFDHFALVLESIVHWAGVVDELDFAKNLCNWTRHGFKELGDTSGFPVSDTITKVVYDEGFLQDPHATAKAIFECRPRDQPDVFADNAALTRTLVLGIPHFHDLTEVANNTVRICLATHADPRCVAAAVMVTVMMALILQGRHDVSKSDELEDLVEKSRKMALQHLTDQTAVDEFVKYTQSESVNVHQKGKESYTLTPVGAALAALRSYKSYRTAITDLVMVGADSKSNACVAGAVLGCSIGFRHLPSHWLDGLREPQTDWLNHKINLLLDMMGLP